MVTRQRTFTPEYIQGCVEGSLNRLGVDTLDVYMLHNPTVENMKNRDSFDLLHDFVKQGKIKHWGVSVNTLPECELAVQSEEYSVMQMEYNILKRDPEAIFEKAKAAGVGVISRVPLIRGFLSGRFKEGHDFAENDIRRRILNNEKIREFQATLDKLQEIAKELGKSAVEVALEFCISNPNVSTVIPGIRTSEQAKQNATFTQANFSLHII
jgi:aryl-alcohol dehydrogenase-like predicted oxidoreductase